MWNRGLSRRGDHASAKEQIIKILQDQPDDSSYDELLRELAFARMIDRGLPDSDTGKTISHEEMGRRIKTWQSWHGRPNPKDGLRDIYDYIARDNPSAAARTIETIYLKAEILREFPQSGYRYWQKPDGHIRILLHGHYRIAYLIKNSDAIDIIGVFHGALDIDRYLL